MCSLKEVRKRRMIKRIKRQMRKKKYSPSSSEKTPKPAVSSEEFHSRVEQKAYELFESRGAAHGSDWADWFEAEKLVKSEIYQR